MRGRGGGVLSPGALVSAGLPQRRREGRSTQEPQGETHTLTQSTQAPTAAVESSPLPATHTPTLHSAGYCLPHKCWSSGCGQAERRD